MLQIIGKSGKLSPLYAASSRVRGTDPGKRGPDNSDKGTPRVQVSVYIYTYPCIRVHVCARIGEARRGRLLKDK